MKFKLKKTLLLSSSMILAPAITTLAISCSNSNNELKKDDKTRVIWIGIDGFSANVWKKHKTPNIKKLLTNSNYSMDAQDIMPSKTYPNWTALFTSMKPDKTGIDSNPGSVYQSKIKKRPTKFNNQGKGVAYSIFDAIKDQTNLKSQFVYPLFKQFNITQIINKDSADFHFSGGNLEKENSKINEITKRKEVKTLMKNKESLMGYISSELTDIHSIKDAGDSLVNQKYEFIFSYISGLDIRGHAFGWGSLEYIKYMNKIDGYIGELLDRINKYDAFKNTIFVLTADHGGVMNKRTHGGDTPDERTVPIIIHNKSQKYSNNLGNISNLDVAPTLAKLLNLKKYKDWDGNTLL